MTIRTFLTAAAALSLIALPAHAQEAKDQTDRDAAAARQAAAQPDATPHADAGAVSASIDRAERDMALRTRGAVEVKGQTAGGFGNVTAHVEVAGGTEVSPDKNSVSGSGSVATGNN